MHSATTSIVSLEAGPRHTWSLLRNGSPLTVRGVGGEGRPDLLAALGGNAFRTWHTDGPRVLDEAHSAGLVVMAGLSVGHERHGFDYADTRRVERQRAEILATVRCLRDHPALLIWGLGNETEGFERPEGNPLVWRELNTLARLVKAEDPVHPVAIVIAGPGEQKLASFQRHCPDVDILGVNAYGDALLIPDALARAGITRPFILTEFGPTGHWEVRQTPWGAPIEPNSREKYRSYLDTHRDVLARAPGNCLGSFAFLWGHKQEVTPTWYGMFLPSGEKTPAVDAMALAWTGEEPETPSPHILELVSPLAEATVDPGSLHEISARISASPLPLALEWRVLEESRDRKIGGDPESVPPEWSRNVEPLPGGRCRVTAPVTAGAYRLFLYARDGRGGGAAANFPFRVA